MVTCECFWLLHGFGGRFEFTSPSWGYLKLCISVNGSQVACQPCRLLNKQSLCRWFYLNQNYTEFYTPYGALPWDTACQGEDWARNIQLPNIDLASQHLYPDLVTSTKVGIARVNTRIVSDLVLRAY